MVPKKSLHLRETELRALLATPAGREELQALEARYFAEGGRMRPEKASIITYIVVYERGRGWIEG